MIMQLDLRESSVLITGAAGFIGASLSKRLLSAYKEIQIVGIDNLNDYYDVNLKQSRLAELRQYPNFRFIKCDLADKDGIFHAFSKAKPDIVIQLAAQAGVRYSITNPDVYIKSNLVGFFHMLEACRHSRDHGEKGVQHFLFASSSSVYGANRKVPYSTEDMTDHPVSLYAATKKADELMAYAYSKLYKVPATGIRFFTVYGPWGRPDMAYFLFTDKMVHHEKIQIFNHGDMYRDFTYIDDTVAGVENVMKNPPAPDEEGVPFHVYNLGNNKPENLMDFVKILENCLLKEGIIDAPAEIELLPMQPGDVYQTFANIDEATRNFGFKPHIGLEEGLSRYAKWYKEYRQGR